MTTKEIIKDDSKVTKLYDKDDIILYQGDCNDLKFNTWKIECIITGFPYVEDRTEELKLLKNMMSELMNYLKPYGILVNTNTDLRKSPTIRLRHIDILEAAKSVGFNLYDYRIWDKCMGHNLYRIAFSHILFFHKDSRPKIRRNLKTDDILPGKALMFGPYHDANSHEVTRTLIEITTEPGDLIYDPFVGSGTLLLEAKELGRKAIGIELDPIIANLAKQRLEYHDEGFAGSRS